MSTCGDYRWSPDGPWCDTCGSASCAPKPPHRAGGEQKPKRIGVTGGRDCNDAWAVMSAMSAVFDKHGGFVLVYGGARGADTLAAEAVAEISLDTGSTLPRELHRADWDKHGKKAGPLRNQAMVDSGLDGLVAFPGGRGTADMVRRARKAGVPVWFPCGEPTP